MDDEKILSDIPDQLPGGFVVFRVDETQDILYVNENVVSFFECSTKDEFLHLVHSSFRYMVKEEEQEDVRIEIHSQLDHTSSYFHHIYFHIITRTGLIRYAESHGHIKEDPKLGKICYLFLLDANLNSIRDNLDPVTHLLSFSKFRENISPFLKEYHSKNQECGLLYLDYSYYSKLTQEVGAQAGNDFLKRISRFLAKIFTRDFITRCEEDHFVILAASQNVQEKVNLISTHFRKNYAIEGIRLKAGYCPMKEESEFSKVLENAKAASSTLDTRKDTFFQIYDESVIKEMEISNYVVNNINTAIEKGYIQIYYQPVVRTISKALCGAEALSRWIDPKYGFLPPNKFITPLEKSHHIQQLDCYVIHRICEDLSRRIRENGVVVPISFNLSKLDFALCDIFSVINREVESHQIPHELIKVEITESIIMSDVAGMTKMIDRFHKAGYDVWMDDFGSGYSSLNVLKDFTFDEIKLDMAFLSNFSEKSQSIIKATIKMAKNIHVQTLAEGVETEEEYLFYRKIGCEKIQGYYFGKPAPYEEMVKNIREKHLPIENLYQKNYYDSFNRIDFLSDSPLLVCEFKNNNFEILFANDVTYRNLSLLGIRDEKGLSHFFNTPSSTLYQKLRNTLPRAIDSGKEEYLYYSISGQYYKLDIKPISSVRESHLFQVRIHNLTILSHASVAEEIDTTMRDVFPVFSSVDILDPEKNAFLSLLSYKKINQDDTIFQLEDLQHAISAFSKGYIYPEDRERYHRFIDPKEFPRKIKESGKGYFCDFFRSADSPSSYSWKEFDIVYTKRDGRDKYVLLVHQLDWEKPEILLPLLKSTLKYNDSSLSGELSRRESFQSHLFSSLIERTATCYFWKDTDRRFLGASKAFLDTYGFSLSQILGKTDEEVGWHLDNTPYCEDEVNVLTKGTIVRDSLGKCIIKGVPHAIKATKWPIYSDGKIIGLMGYFIDLQSKEDQDREKLAMVDIQTGLLNPLGMMVTILDYADQYHREGLPYSLIMLSLSNIDLIASSYGEKIKKDILAYVSGLLIKQFGADATLCHLMDNEFAILLHEDRIPVLEEHKTALHEALMASKEIDHVRVNLYNTIVYHLASEADDDPQKLFDMVRKELRSKEKQQ